eukprot:1144540-Pelagomonas_calceolata.AAC.8
MEDKVLWGFSVGMQLALRRAPRSCVLGILKSTQVLNQASQHSCATAERGGSFHPAPPPLLRVSTPMGSIQAFHNIPTLRVERHGQERDPCDPCRVTHWAPPPLKSVTCVTRATHRGPPTPLKGALATRAAASKEHSDPAHGCLNKR